MGRAAELRQLAVQLDRAGSGSGSVLLIEGEAGIGKSRLVAAALDLARDRGFALAHGVADELSRHQPFGVLADALGLNGSSLDSERAALARLLASGGDPFTSPVSPPPYLGRQVSEAMRSLLEGMAASSPVLVVVEDLNWADPSTLVTFRALARHLVAYQAMLVGTLRPLPRGPEVDRLVDHLVAESATHLVLGPLDEASVAELVTAVVGAPPGSGLLDQVGGASGNPLFILELLWALLDEDQLDVVDGHVESRSRLLPSDFVESVLHRLTFLMPATLEALQVASVLGPSFSLSDLSVVLGRPVTDLMGAVSEVMAARLVGEAGAHLAFRHSLVHESIYAHLPHALRHGLHRDVARALAAAGAPPRRVADHLIRSAKPHDTEAVEWLERAAREVAPHSPGTAADYLARASEHLEASDPRHFRLLVERVMGLAWAGRAGESQQVASQALAFRPDPSVEADLRLGLARSLLAQGRGREAADQADAAADLPGLGDGLRAELWAAAAMGRLFEGELGVAAGQAERALAVGEAVGNRLASCVALCTLAMVAYYRGDFAGAVPLGARAVEEAQEDPEGQASRHHPWFFLGIALLNADRFDEARESFEVGRRLAEQLGTQWGLPLYHMGLALHHFQKGAWDDAAAELEAALAYGDDLDSQAGAIWVYNYMAQLHIHSDDLSMAEAALDAAETELRRSGIRVGAGDMMWAKALLCEACGDVEAALALLEMAYEQAAAQGIMADMPAIGPLLVRLAEGSRPELALAVTTSLEGAAARFPAPRFEGSALRCRGLLEENVETLLAAVAAYRLDPRPWLVSEALEDAARAMARAGRADEARPLLEEALAGYEQLGARRDIARVLAALRAVGVRPGRRGPRQRPKRGWGSLTETEHRVVELVVDGLSNAKVGERLFISRRTVDTHLSHVFAKLDVLSRRELADVASRHARPD